MTTSTLPFSLAIAYPDLVKYRLYYVVRHLEMYKEMQNLAFDPNASLYRHVDKHCKQIHEIYEKLPTTEIWSEITFHSTINKMDFMYRNNQLSSTTFLRLLDQMEELVEQSSQYAKNGNKQLTTRIHVNSHAPSYTLYLNNTSAVEETTLLSWYEQNRYKLFIYHPSFGFTTEPNAKAKIERRCRSLQEMATLISATNAPARNRFFGDVRVAIRKKREKLEKH